MKPVLPKKIEELWVFIGVQKDGEEKVLSNEDNNALLAFTPEHMQIGLLHMQAVADVTGDTIIVRHYPASEIVATMAPHGAPL